MAAAEAESRGKGGRQDKAANGAKASAEKGAKHAARLELLPWLLLRTKPKRPPRPKMVAEAGSCGK